MKSNTTCDHEYMFVVTVFDSTACHPKYYFLCSCQLEKLWNPEYIIDS